MSIFLVSFDLKSANTSEYKSLYDAFENFGNFCKLTSTTSILDAEIEVDELIDELSKKLGDNDTLFIIDLETLEIDGINLPDCLENFVASDEEIDEENTEEFDNDLS
ncbi:hypothetical protein J7L68_02345 [bacterium]|nr:hypothetical protein [bacterium]